MGYGLHPYAVQLHSIESLLERGSGSGGLFRKFLGPSSGSLVQKLKRKYPDRFEDEDDDYGLTLEDALTHLLNASEMDLRSGHKYGYAFELLCDHFGEFLDNSAWSAAEADWPDQVQAALVQAALKQAGMVADVFSLTDHLAYRGAPIAIPKPDDFPCIGFLRAEEIDRAASVLRTADLSTTDEEIRGSVEQIRRWFEQCQSAGCDLVCFRY